LLRFLRFLTFEKKKKKNIKININSKSKKKKPKKTKTQKNNLQIANFRVRKNSNYTHIEIFKAATFAN